MEQNQFNRKPENEERRQEAGNVNRQGLEQRVDKRNEQVTGRGNEEDTDAATNTSKTQDTKGEAQNVNDDNGRPLSESEISDARNKANEGQRQGRDD